MNSAARFRAWIPLLLVVSGGCASGGEAGERASETSVAPAGPAPATEVASVDDVPWTLTGGTTTLGFGILRLAPGPPGGEATFRIRYLDWGDGGYASDSTNACLMVLPGDAFARSDAAFADAWLAFDRVENVGDGVEVAVTVRVREERSLLVAYGPWRGADVGRPPSDTHTYNLDVEPLDGGNWRWVESEAGEMVTTNWTSRPGVVRGGPVADPLTGRPLWIETRVLVLYDPKNARPADVAPADAAAAEAMPLRPELHETLARVPIRWR